MRRRGDEDELEEEEEEERKMGVISYCWPYFPASASSLPISMQLITYKTTPFPPLAIPPSSSPNLQLLFKASLLCKRLAR